jgi:ABC-type bacteriocin/lantibiotic exporter with double-glycine peptidase domain
MTARASRWPLGPARQRVPVVRQVTQGDCGAACLAMVLGYHGRHVGLEELRTIARDRNAVSARTLLEAASHHGLRGRGVKVELEDLGLLTAPAILHWEFNHYVVFEGATEREVRIVDPAAGPRRVSMDLFRRSFTGVALVFEKGEWFTPQRSQPRAWRYFWEVFARSRQIPRILGMSLAIQLFVLAGPVLTGILVDRVIPWRDQPFLRLVGIGVSVLVVLHFLASFVRAHLLLQMRTTLDARMTMGFIEHLLSLPFDFFQGRSTGDLLLRLSSNSTIREMVTTSAVSGLLDGALATTYLVLLLAASPPMALIVLCLGALRGGVLFVSRHKQRQLAVEGLQVQAKASTYQIELLTGVETIKAMGAEQRAIERLENLLVDSLNVSIRRGRLDALADSMIGALAFLSPLVVVGYGALQVMDGRLALGFMLGLCALGGAFLGPLSSLLNNALRLQMLSVYIERIDDVLSTPPEQGVDRPRVVPRLRGEIRLEQVSFRYAPTAPFAVSEVSVSIEAGQRVAIVGRSGAGKSTLANLLAGLFRPTSGRILFDGMDLATLDIHGVRRQLGIYTQTHHLFTATVRENIALSDPSIPKEQVIEAAKLARIHEDVLALPMGYDTLLSHRASALSGGQRQRIALARALVGQPRILLLDEATSSLDAVTEREIHEALATVGCTRIVIAHRLSTVMSADWILVLDRGRLVEQGVHKDLLALGGCYATLVHAQLEGGEDARG